jgi:hypothetical protein
MKPVDNEPQRSHRVCSLHFCYGKPKKEQHSASDVYLNSDIKHLNFKIWCHSKRFDSIIL